MIEVFNALKNSIPLNKNNNFYFNSTFNFFFNVLFVQSNKSNNDNGKKDC